MIDHYVRPPLRKLLLRLLHWTESGSQPAVCRGGDRKVWQKEIQIPTYMVAAISIAAFFVVLIFEIGLSWLKIAGLVLPRDGLRLPGHLPAPRAQGAGLGQRGHHAARPPEHQRGPAHADGEGAVSLLATPVAAFVILIGLLLSRRLAFVMGIILSLIVGVLNNFSLEYFFVHMFGSMTVVAFLPGIRTRSDITRLGLKLLVTNVLAILIIHFFRLWPLRTLEVNVLLAR